MARGLMAVVSRALFIVTFCWIFDMGIDRCVDGHVDISTGSKAPVPIDVPEFPLVRFQSGGLVYEEVLIGGQYMAAHWSAAGRLSSRHQLWEAFKGGQAAWRPFAELSTRLPSANRWAGSA